MRQHSATSKAAEDFIKPFKPNHKYKILVGLETLRVGGTYEEIARATGMKESQVWKRMNECLKDGTVFDTGITRKLSSGLQGTVWQRTGLNIINPENPKTEKEMKDLSNAGIKPNSQADQIIHNATKDQYVNGKLF